tara:strand:+ start:6128 stop:6661 length:534 start_codon:yes stop_codon:yes gene_type:complete
MAGLKFRVLLDSKDKSEIFRDILISDSDNFESFYKTILSSYHFTSDQMASFYISNDAWDKGHEITLFDMSFSDSDEGTPDVMSTTTIREFIETKDQKMILLHDFLRMWFFLIELIEYQEETPDQPQIVLSVGNSPSEESKSAEGEDIQFETDHESGEEEEDDYGFNEFEDGYDQYDY